MSVAKNILFWLWFLSKFWHEMTLVSAEGQTLKSVGSINWGSELLVWRIQCNSQFRLNLIFRCFQPQKFIKWLHEKPLHTFHRWRLQSIVVTEIPKNKWIIKKISKNNRLYHLKSSKNIFISYNIFVDSEYIFRSYIFISDMSDHF